MADMYFRPTEYSFPNLVIEETYNSETNARINYRLTPADGYVFYDSTENNTMPDPNNPMLEIPVTYYYTLAYLPLSYNFNNFPYVAVLRSSVDENNIFGGSGNNEHEAAEAAESEPETL